MKMIRVFRNVAFAAVLLGLFALLPGRGDRPAILSSLRMLSKSYPAS